MKIVSFIQEVFQEYQDQISLLMCAQGCSFSCPWCHVLPMVKDESNIIGEAREIAEKFLTPLNTAVVLTGGEPFIWGKDVFDFGYFVKSKNLKFKIFTNGFHYSDVMAINELGLVDAYSIDFKGVTNIDKAIGDKQKAEEYLDAFLISCHNIRSKKIPLEIRVTKHMDLDLTLSLEFLSQKVPGTTFIIQDLVQYEDNT
jgi:pyruvate-formate lyase-activating enzyme